MEREFPKNVRQIGNVCDEPKIYVEDYVDTYLCQLRMKAAEKPVAAALVGELTTQEGQAVAYISGAIQMKDIEVKGTEILIDEETQKLMEEERGNYFEGLEILGWCLIETGHPMSLNRGAVKIQSKLFPKENTIFIWKDAVERDEMFFAYKYGDLMQMGGHYIYYERNPFMQNYMINTRRQNGVTPSEMVEDRAAKDFRSTIREKTAYKEQKRDSRLLYMTSLSLVVVVLAIGVGTMNHVDKIEAMQSSVEKLTEAISKTQTRVAEVDAYENAEEVSSQMIDEEIPDVTDEVSGEVTVVENIDDSSEEALLTEEDFYVVQKGDTLDSISIELYGSRKHVDAICQMNGLTDGNLIFIGQKLLLP